MKQDAAAFAQEVVLDTQNVFFAVSLSIFLLLAFRTHIFALYTGHSIKNQLTSLSKSSIKEIEGFHLKRSKTYESK